MNCAVAGLTPIGRLKKCARTGFNGFASLKNCTGRGLTRNARLKNKALFGAWRWAYLLKKHCLNNVCVVFTPRRSPLNKGYAKTKLAYFAPF